MLNVSGVCHTRAMCYGEQHDNPHAERGGACALLGEVLPIPRARSLMADVIADAMADVMASVVAGGMAGRL